MELYNPTGSHVVTLGVDFADGRIPTRVLCEVFRGDADECQTVMARMSCPSHDRRPIEHWWLQCGCVEAWEEFAREAHAAE